MSTPRFSREVIKSGPIRAVSVSLIALSVIVGAWLAVRSATGPHSVSGGRPTPSPTSEPPPSAIAPPLDLVRGARLAAGVPVGYPHTQTGAISAAWQYMRDVYSTYDPDAVAAAMRVIGDPAVPDEPAMAARGIEGRRRDLGLPASGPLPPGAYYSVSPQMFQVRPGPDTDHVLVLLLTGELATTYPSAPWQHRRGVYPMHMRWVDGDWRLAALGGDGENFMDLIAEPQSADAYVKGWRDCGGVYGSAS